MEKLQLKEAIEQELEEIGVLPVQRENVENEYQLKHSVLNDFQERKNTELKKGKRKRKIIAGGVATGYFAFLTGIMPLIANSVASLPNKFSWFFVILRSFSVEGIVDWISLVGLSFTTCGFFGIIFKNVLDIYAEKKINKKLGNFDENAYTEIKELEEIKSKIETELNQHKNELMWYKSNLQILDTYDEKLDPGMIQYNTYSSLNAEMDIAKNPYTK